MTTKEFLEVIRTFCNNVVNDEYRELVDDEWIVPNPEHVAGMIATAQGILSIFDKVDTLGLSDTE